MVLTKSERTTSGLLQGWLDIEAMVILSLSPCWYPEAHRNAVVGMQGLAMCASVPTTQRIATKNKPTLSVLNQIQPFSLYWYPEARRNVVVGKQCRAMCSSVPTTQRTATKLKLTY